MATLRVAAARLVIVESALVVEAVRYPDEMVGFEGLRSAKHCDVLADGVTPFRVAKLFRRRMAKLTSSRMFGCRFCEAERGKSELYILKNI